MGGSVERPSIRSVDPENPTHWRAPSHVLFCCGFLIVSQFSRSSSQQIWS